ncbi:MAG: hypothetical protein R6U32_07320 [Candidatus Woesearchaeota archaeon]
MAEKMPSDRVYVFLLDAPAFLATNPVMRDYGRISYGGGELVLEAGSDKAFDFVRDYFSAGKEEDDRRKKAALNTITSIDLMTYAMDTGRENLILD